MMAAARGLIPDVIPFSPRIDLWFNSNKVRGTLPGKYRNAKNADEIALSEGWALNKVILEFMAYGEDAISDRALGVYRIPTQGFISNLSEDVKRKIYKNNDEFHVEYRTPVGNISGTFVLNEEMRRSGISIPWIKEHTLKTPSDCRTLGFIFENIHVEPAYEEFLRWADNIGENGMPVAYALTAGSPMHHIMKIFLDSTNFYYHYKDNHKEMLELEDKIGTYFKKVIDVIAESPAEVILVGANFDDMLTYPPFFKIHILPWLQMASDKFHQKNKLLLSHTDGENKGLLDLLYESGIDIADSVCPYPMTKISIGEYYRKWSNKITLMGGIPSNIMLKDCSSDAGFDEFVEKLFIDVYPGTRFILGIADNTPPDADFERLRRIQKKVNQLSSFPFSKKERYIEVKNSLEDNQSKT